MEKSTFQFRNFTINKSLIEFKNRKEVDSESDFSLKFQPSGVIHSKDGIFELMLETLINDKEENLLIELSVTAFFVFNSELGEKKLSSLFYVNAPSLLFPYLRAHITTLTALSGIEPIILPTLNLSRIGKNLEENTTILD